MLALVIDDLSRHSDEVPWCMLFTNNIKIKARLTYKLEL